MQGNIVGSVLLETDAPVQRASGSGGPPGQFNLFTGELDPFSDEPAALPEEAWLFDPDFGLVLPDGSRCQVSGFRCWGRSDAS
jgi:hypothetical protein